MYAVVPSWEDSLHEPSYMTAVVNVCVLIITQGTDREGWESQDWHADKDCSEQQTARPIVLHLSFCLPVLDQSGMGGTKGILCS